MWLSILCTVVLIFLFDVAVCVSIQAAGLHSLRFNQVECINEEPAMHVDRLLCANEPRCDGGKREEVEGGREVQDP